MHVTMGPLFGRELSDKVHNLGGMNPYPSPSPSPLASNCEIEVSYRSSSKDVGG